MKNLFKTILLFTLFLLGFQKANASHVAGAEISYSHLSGNSYVVHFVLYRDCSGEAALLSLPITVSSLSCVQSINVVAQAIPGTGLEVTPFCAAHPNTCAGGTLLGIQKWEYEAAVSLPAQCSDWVFSFSITGRSTAITTLMGDSVLYVEALLDNSIDDNSSPWFAVYPSFLLLAGQSTCIPTGCFDPDGDSLVYAMIAPRTDANTNCSYAGGYNVTNPVSSSPPVNFTTSTGDLCITPTIPGEVGVIAVMVQEYRNGTLIGSIVRDFVVHMVLLTNTAPYLYLSLQGFSFSICAGNDFNLDALSYDSDSGQTLTLTWNSGIAGATFTTTGSPHPSGHFHWATTAADVRPQPYTFVMILNDDGCPSFGAQVYSFSLIVTSDSLPPVPTLQFIPPDLITQPGYSYQWYYSADSITYLLTGNNDDSIQPVNDGYYYVVITGSNGCFASSETFYFNPQQVGDMKSVDDIIIFPNPASGDVTIHTSNLLSDAVITIYNMYGQQVKQEDLISKEPYTLHCADLSGGIYFIRLTENDKTLGIEKLVIAD